jgi:hypothetical protein
MFQEIHPAATPEDYFKELVEQYGKFCIPGAHYLDKVEPWKDTGWFDLEPCLRNGKMTNNYRLNSDGLRSVINHHHAVAIKLGLHKEHVSVAADLATFIFIMKEAHPCGGSSAV